VIVGDAGSTGLSLFFETREGAHIDKCVFYCFYGVSNGFSVCRGLVPRGEMMRLELPPIEECSQDAVRFLHERIQELEARLAYVERISRTDHLTGLLNLRGMEESLLRMAADCLRRQIPFGMIYMDLMGFKSINDKSGQPMGDAVLRRVAEVLGAGNMRDTTSQAALRPSDVGARVGGDEFVVLLPGAHVAVVRYVAQRLSEKLNNTCVRLHDAEVIGIGTHVASAVIVTREELMSPMDSLYRPTAAAMSASKRALKR